MFKVPLSNPAIKRTLRPLYAQHQATPQACFLDPNFNRSFDILPGTVMARSTKELMTPFTGATGQKPYGLSALFVAPVLGIDEVIDTGQNLFAVWVGNADSQFEVLSPAFDKTGDWSLPTDGSIKLLTGNAQGRLTPTGATAANAAAELLNVVGADKIIIRPVRPTVGS